MKNWSFDRWVTVLTLVASLVSFVFGLGVNYATVMQLRKDFDQHVAASEQIQREYVTQDEANIQFKSLEGELKRVHDSMDMLTATLLQERAAGRR